MAAKSLAADKSGEPSQTIVGNAAHLLADYQPPNQTNKTPKKRRGIAGIAVIKKREL